LVLNDEREIVSANYIAPARRWLIVLVTMLSWFGMSNHCVLGIAIPRDRPARSECPFHSHPSKPAKQKTSSELPCCKILRAIAVSFAKNLARAIVDLDYVDLAFANLVVFAPPKISFRSATLDTGPPGATSFAELIGSMHAHAPPVLA
jgi:hypothetical protein